MVVVLGLFTLGGCAKKQVVEEAEAPEPVVQEPKKPEPPPPPVVAQPKPPPPKPEPRKPEPPPPPKLAQATTEGLQRIHFDFDKSNIRPDARNVLIKNAEFLRENSGVKIRIEGHCDERGTNEYNLALGERRAKSALQYLADLGVDPNRMSIISYGEEQPLDPGHNESAWAKNRRAEFVKQQR